jgi:hypothetical protein
MLRNPKGKPRSVVLKKKKNYYFAVLVGSKGVNSTADFAWS